MTIARALAEPVCGNRPPRRGNDNHDQQKRVSPASGHPSLKPQIPPGARRWLRRMPRRALRQRHSGPQAAPTTLIRRPSGRISRRRRPARTAYSPSLGRRSGRDGTSLPTWRTRMLPARTCLAAEFLHAPPLAVRIATVAAGALSFFMCHGNSSAATALEARHCNRTTAEMGPTPWLAAVRAIIPEDRANRVFIGKPNCSQPCPGCRSG